MPGIDDMFCCLCGERFDQRSFGKLNCWCHPIEYDISLGYYPCCGLTERQSDMKFRASKKTYGCTKIDHVYSKEDFENVLEHPYFLIPFDEISHVEIFSKPTVYRINTHGSPSTSAGTKLKSTDAFYFEKKGYIIPILNDEKFGSILVFNSFRDKIGLDIEALHNNVKDENYNVKFVFKDVANSDDDDAEDDSASNWFEYSHRDSLVFGSTGFIPFYIVRRMESEVSEEVLCFDEGQGNLQRFENLKRQKIK
jgi:hypothetical protein